MTPRALTSVAIVALSASLFVACGDGDGTTTEQCPPNSVECLSDKSGVVCTSDGSARYPFDCDDGQVCAPKSRVLDQGSCFAHCESPFGPGA